MRCLHCNKKLSLLKMAKGDSFCSPEHFDAYQLQLSRSAYDRLISLPEEDAPKPPLILKTETAEPARDLEADSALARLSVFRAPEKNEAGAALKVPPFARFLASPPPFHAPNPAVPASEPEGSEPVEGARTLAFPVHDVEATVCILNLYLRLGLAETPPRDWAPEWEIIAAPEDFLGEITRPTLASGTNIEPFENPVLEEPALEEMNEPVEAADSLEPLLSFEEQPVLEPGDPGSGIESFENLELSEIEPAHAVEAVALAEGEEPALEAVVLDSSFEDLAPSEAESIEPVPEVVSAESFIDEPWAAPAAKAIHTVERRSEPEPEKRLPFLVAPTFGERDWDAVPFDAAASSAPRDWTLAPALDTVQETGEVWSGAIAESTGFAGIPPLQPRDAAGQRIQSGSPMTAVVAPLLPGEEAIESFGWQASSGQIGIGRPPLETTRVSTRAVDFALPAPAPVRPIATLPAGARGMIPEAGSLMRSVLETAPKGREPAPVILPVNAKASGLMAILAPFPAWERSSPALRNQSPRFSRRPAVADSAGPREFAAEPLHYLPDCGKDIQQDAAGEQAPLVAMRPYRATEWRGADFDLPAGADPTPTGWQPPVGLLNPEGVWDRPELAENVVWRSVFERRFTAASQGVFGHLESTVLAPAALPAAADIPVRDWRIGICAPTIVWNPCLPATPNRPLAFLPSRGSAILPSARSWPRLGALAQ
jgi:hypothetical protein